MQAWEYKVVRLRRSGQNFAEEWEKNLNELGAEGWEIFILLRVEEHSKPGDTVFLTAVFKRPGPAT